MTFGSFIKAVLVCTLGCLLATAVMALFPVLLTAFIVGELMYLCLTPEYKAKVRECLNNVRSWFTSMLS